MSYANLSAPTYAPLGDRPTQSRRAGLGLVRSCGSTRMTSQVPEVGPVEFLCDVSGLAPLSMSERIDPARDCTVIELRGELCTVSIARSAGLIEQSVAGLSGCVHVDVSGVEFIDARGVRLLRRLSQMGVAGQREVNILRPSPVVRRVVEACALNSILAGPAVDHTVSAKV